jgi:hypothetical protein
MCLLLAPEENETRILQSPILQANSSSPSFGDSSTRPEQTALMPSKHLPKATKKGRGQSLSLNGAAKLPPLSRSTRFRETSLKWVHSQFIRQDPAQSLGLQCPPVVSNHLLRQVKLRGSNYQSHQQEKRPNRMHRLHIFEYKMLVRQREDCQKRWHSGRG